MAEGSLLLLMTGKIAGALAQQAVMQASSLVTKEVALLLQIHSRMSQIKSEFEVIQAFLSYTDAWKDNSPILDTWVKQVREVAFDVEDIMDEYTHLLGKYDQDKPGLSLRMNKAIHRIAYQLEEILNRLCHLREMKDRYGIKTSDGKYSLGIAADKRQNLAVNAHFIDKDEIVGFNDNETKLTEWLTSKAYKQFTIMSVWGMAGLGKTALVTKVYNSQKIREHFSCRAWISVSQNYRTDELLKRIIKELLQGKEDKGKEQPAPGVIDTMDHKSLVETLHNLLQDQMYIIVLDDVWSTSVWTDICDVLKSDKHESRVVLTTRDETVASHADADHRMKLEPLPEEEAIKLLKKKAFDRDEESECSQELEELSRAIVQKCGCLPLAIVAVGRLLLLRKKEKPEWEKVLEGLNWELTSNPELDQLKSALALSYRLLPSYLKHCLLYCSMFPGGYPIRRNMLIRLWVAEGFVERRGGQTLEEVAEDNLNQLVYRSVLQVVERNEFERVKIFRMHDIMREMVLSLSEREGFGHVYEHSQQRLQGKIRRLSVHRCGEQNEIRNVSMSHIRSLVSFDPVKLHFKSFKLLRVLDLQGLPLQTLPNAVWDLFNLHYLGLRNTQVERIPSSIKKLIYLETLDLAFTKITKLPNRITKLKHLRNLFVHTMHDPTSKSYNYFTGFPAPKGIWNLENLQTLQGVEANKEFVEHLVDMVQLQSFRIIKVRAAHHAELCGALKKMERLHRLDIVAATEDKKDELVLDLSPPPPRLQKLTMRGKLHRNVLPDWFSSLVNLKWLRLGWSGLEGRDPLRPLQDLPNLVFLLLLRAYDGRKLCFQKEGFQKLKSLRLVDMANLKEVQVEEGALPSLCQLNLVRCGKLAKAPQGVKTLLENKLEALYLEEMPESLVEELEKFAKVRVIPISEIYRTEGRWPLEGSAKETTAAPYSGEDFK